MTAQIVITLAIIGAEMLLFVWYPIPAAMVAVCASLALYFTGILTVQETLAGFGDPARQPQTNSIRSFDQHVQATPAHRRGGKGPSHLTGSQSWGANRTKEIDDEC